MNADIQNIVIAIDQPNGFLRFTVYINFLEPCELPNSVVNVRYVISWVEPGDLFQGQRFLATLVAFSHTVTVVAFKDLVVSETRQFQLMIYEPFMNRKHD